MVALKSIAKFVVAFAAFIGAAHAQMVPGSYPVGLDQNHDQSGLVISGANQNQVPLSQWGDQGYIVNAWANCDCVGNPALNNNDTVRIVGYNAGTGPAQVNGLSVYMVGGAANADGIGATTGLHVNTVSKNSGSVWGLAIENADSPFLAGYDGPGRYIDNEIDMQIGGSQTIATWLSLGGTLFASPAYGAGLTLNYIGPGKIHEFIYSHDGMADVALHIGRFSKQQHADDGSQSVIWDFTDHNNINQSMTMTAYGNSMVLQSTAGQASYATIHGAGITDTVAISTSCQLKIDGGIVIGTQGNCQPPNLRRSRIRH